MQPGGTGPRARIMGWRVAGKTGTAHKLENGGYAAEQVPRIVRRLRAGLRAAPGGRGDDRRAVGRRALRRRGRGAGVRAGDAGRAAPARRAARRAARADRAAARAARKRRRAPDGRAVSTRDPNPAAPRRARRDDRAAVVGQPPLRAGRGLLRLSGRGGGRARTYRRRAAPRRGAVLWEESRFRVARRVARAERSRSAASSSKPARWRTSSTASPRVALDVRRHRHQRQDFVQPVDRRGARQERHAPLSSARSAPASPARSTALPNTTPDALEIQALLKKFLRRGERRRWRWRSRRTASSRAASTASPSTARCSPTCRTTTSTTTARWRPTRRRRRSCSTRRASGRRCSTSTTRSARASRGA